MVSEQTSFDDDGSWQRLHPASAMLRSMGSALSATVTTAVALIAAGQIPQIPSVGVAPALGLVVAAACWGAWVGRARWRRTRWRLDRTGLYVRRGWLWREEVLVPRSRVQHLDLERGPIERRLGLASVIVHTAGSQTPALRQSGLAEADAVALRDALIPDANRSDDAL